jgi:predicted nucleic acid-binding protein
MPSNADRQVLVDTSVAVALLVGDHQHHAAVAQSLAGMQLGLPGHAAFETFSVLTRLPAPLRRTAAAAGRLLHGNFPHTAFLSESGSADLFTRLAKLGITGGAVYDALVGATAAEHGLPLVTRDLRAVDTYRALDVDVELIA